MNLPAKRPGKLHGMINKKQSHTPLPELIGRLNGHLKGWANDYRRGHSRCAFRDINWFVEKRLWRHLRRRSQRQWRPARGISFHSQLVQMGLVQL
jgi:RNA-directed DNA polymerase